MRQLGSLRIALYMAREWEGSRSYSLGVLNSHEEGIEVKKQIDGSVWVVCRDSAVMQGWDRNRTQVTLQHCHNIGVNFWDFLAFSQWRSIVGTKVGHTPIFFFLNRCVCVYIYISNALYYLTMFVVAQSLCAPLRLERYRIESVLQHFSISIVFLV